MKAAIAPKRGHADDELALTGSLPKISFTAALRSWFVYRGRAYNVETCKQRLFVAYIKSITAYLPAKTRAAYLECDVSPDDRMLARWYTLDSCLLLKVPALVLYESEQQAQESMQDTEEGDVCQSQLRCC